LGETVIVEMFENEFLEILNNTPMMLNLIQGKNAIPSHILDIFRNQGIIPFTQIY